MSKSVSFSCGQAAAFRLRCRCGGVMALSLEAIVNGRAVQCDGCEVKIRVDLRSSAGAVDALARAMAKLARVRREIS